MAVRRAPATLCPISSPLSPSLTFLFWILFLPPFFFSLCFVIPMLYLLCQRNPTPLPLPFLSSRAAPFRLNRLIFLFQPSLHSQIFMQLHFYTITFRNACSALYTLFFPLIPRLETIPSNSFLDQSFIHVCRFIRQTGRKAAGYYQDRCCKILAPCIFLRHPVRILRTVSPVDYPRLPFNPQSIPKLPR